MSASPQVISAQNGAARTGCWQGIALTRPSGEKALETPSARLTSGDVSSSGDELNTKVRKPYTITKQRERWTEDEHEKFLEALKLYGRAWRRIEEHIRTKTAVQIRSHAQKFFSKLEREASNGGSAGKQQDIEIPPPRPKRKPSHPYPRKAGGACLNSLSPMDEESRASPVACPASSSIAASSVPASIGSCQPAAFTPYIGKGGPVLDATILHNSALGSTYFLGPEGRIKLFGKTVLVPTSQKTAVHEDFKEIAIKEKIHQGSPARKRMLPASTQTGKTDLKHKRGFVPYVKVAKKLVSIPGDALSSGINASGSGISALEDTGESNVEIPCMPLVEVQCTAEGLSADGKLQKHLDTNLQCLSRRHSLLQEAEVEEFPRDVPDQTTNNETSQMSRDSCQNVSNKDCFSHSNPAAANIARQFSAMLAPQNNATYLWMDSLVHYYGRLPALSLASCSPTDGQSNNPNTPWNFLQAAAMTHPAAYAAAIATAGWTRSVSGGQTPVASDVYSVPTSLNNVNASAFTAAAASWWGMRGLVPPGFVHPPAGAISKCAGSVANITSGTFVQNVEILDDTVKQEQGQEQEQERTSDPATDDEAATSENNTEPENAVEDEHIEKNKPEKENDTLKIRDAGDFCSSATAAPGEISIEERAFLCETKDQCKVEMPYISPEVPLTNTVSQEVEKAKSAWEQGQQSPCSADEVDAGKKNPREGSSSGSNTTMFRHHSSESETPITSGNGVKGKDDASKKHNTCDDATGHCHQENQLNGSCCPKMRFKHLEKGTKYQHRDFRHGDDDNVKRFKSCAHDMDMRKEVSQEGRKAFQALFTCRTLPQTFPSVLTSEDIRNPAGILEQDVLMDSVTIDVEGASCVLTQSEKAGSGGVESCRSLPKTVNNEQKEVKHGEAHLSEYANVVSTSIAYTEMGIPARSFDRRDDTEKSVKCHYLSISKEVDAKIFSIGSRFGRSGFVPYQRPLTKIKANPHFAPSTFDNKHGSSGSGVQKVPDIVKGFS